MARSIISRRTFLTGLGGAAALALAPPAIRLAAAPAPAADPAVIRDWANTAAAVIATDAGKANVEFIYWASLVQAAVYNAVVGITRRYATYQWNDRGPTGASPQAAAAAAAHRVLETYFGDLPAAQERITSAYAASLDQIPDGLAKHQGIVFGEGAADHIIELRADDGRFAPVTFDMPLAPGVWRPTPPASAPFFDPWLGQLMPLMLESPSQFRPPAPAALNSAAYAEEFNEVKAIGSKTSTVRTAAQSATALFMPTITFIPMQAALGDLVTRHAMDISDSARLLAAVDMSAADGAVACWDSKLQYGLWRPITAIRMADEDGNPATVADLTWEPFIPTPPYPDYVSGLCALMGAVTRSLTRVLGTERIDLYLTSPASGATRYYEFASGLCTEGVEARICSGIHFRTADVLGITLGEQVANWGLDHNFMPM